ncbi:Hypp7007 [Branchiostoma lanceolatum]|uniref:Hypp7007 protein n=1 Tax=Branchiostoma lanceolatum TaxID=7740 RepID=A0A8J9YWH7_BRALA|nr:Hypp7007 [Branchiostoma lanceolatum]
MEVSVAEGQGSVGVLFVAEEEEGEEEEAIPVGEEGTMVRGIVEGEVVRSTRAEMRLERDVKITDQDTSL